MKNKNLKKAFQILDSETLKHSENVPAEELYYSPEYEKRMETLLKEKKGFSWKKFWKRAVPSVLGAALIIGIFSSIPKNTQPDQPDTPPVQTELTQIDGADFVIVSEGMKQEELAEMVKQNGYAEGTYEYEYMQILSEISYYTGIAQNYLANAKYHKENAVHDKYDTISSNFVKGIDIDKWNAPYEDIVRYGVEVLNCCGFTPTQITSEMLRDYWFCESDLGIRRGVTTCAGLPLTDLHEKVTEYAEKLLTLEEKYPDYEGDLSVSTYVREMAEKLKEACRSVCENEETYLLAWQTYYDGIQPKVIITEEFIPELDAVKIPITGEGRYAAYALADRYIENYQYETFANENFIQKQQIPTQTFSIYLPIYVYTKENPLKTIAISKYHAEDTIGEVRYEDVYTLTIDPREYYSDESITLENDALDEAFRKHFGGDYSERDLLAVSAVYIQAKPNPALIFDVRENGKTSGFRVELELTETLPGELENDLRHLHGLFDVVRNSYGETESIVSEELAEELRPYIVNPDADTRTTIN